MIGENSRERNRIQKVLEDANVKLGDVLSDVFCVSGRLMLQALLDGELSPDQIAELAFDPKEFRTFDHGYAVTVAQRCSKTK